MKWLFKLMGGDEDDVPSIPGEEPEDRDKKRKREDEEDVWMD